MGFSERRSSGTHEIGHLVLPLSEYAVRRLVMVTEPLLEYPLPQRVEPRDLPIHRFLLLEGLGHTNWEPLRFPLTYLLLPGCQLFLSPTLPCVWDVADHWWRVWQRDQLWHPDLVMTLTS